MVVARAEMGVAPQLTILAAQNQHHLGVGLVAHHAVDHHCPGLLQAAGQLQVGFLIEACPQLDDRGDLFAVTRGFNQCVDDFRVGTRAIERLLDGQDAGILRRLAQQVDHRSEGFIGVQQQDVLFANHAEDVFAVL